MTINNFGTKTRTRNNSFTAADLDKFAKSFITEEIINQAKLRRVSDLEGAEIIGRKSTGGDDYSGITFPYFLPSDYEYPRDYVLRLDNPKIENGKEQGKYLHSKGSGNKIYFPPNIQEASLKDVSLPIVITEGEKKALGLYRAATENLMLSQWKFLPLALSGVSNFRGKTGKSISANGKRIDDHGVIPDFEQITWEKRRVVILFDKNALTNRQVYSARYHLAQTLISLGAIVYLANLPKIDEINGIDDLLWLWEREYGEREAFNRLDDLLANARKFVVNVLYSHALVNGNLFFKVEPVDRNKFKVSAFDTQNRTFAMDVLNLADAEKRAKFIKHQVEPAIPLTDADRQVVLLELMRLADIAAEVTKYDEATSTNESENIVETSFHVLQDGRIIEQIRGGFAVYEPDTGNYLILDSVTDSDGTIYKPIQDALFHTDGALYLANDLTEYGSEAELDADIEKYISTFLDLKPLPLKLTAKYIRFTYLFDKVLELSYLNATGDAGSGKSRFGLTVALASRRGIALITPSAASVYRIVDKFQPTFFIDEFNSDANSDDAAAIIQILNAGFQQTAKIPRQASTGDGNFKTEMFNPYCPKIIGSLKQSASNAFNSRCIEIQMERTDRNDIPLRLSHKLLNHAQILRNKLTLYRLRNFTRDFEAALDLAETELRQAGIVPRSIQINIPLYALIEDVKMKQNFIELLKGRDEVLIEEKRNSFDGELVQVIHDKLFDVDETGATLLNPLPADNQICEALRVDAILEELNKNRGLKDQMAKQYLGRKINALHLKTKKILLRSSQFREQKAIVFDLARLALLFKIYGLPVSEEFNVTNCHQSDNFNNDKDLTWCQQNHTNCQNDSCCHQAKHNDFNSNGSGDIWCQQNSGNNPQRNKTCFVCSIEMILIEEEQVYFCQMCGAKISIN